MTTIFPKQSVYCPKLSWEERAYGFKHKDPFFNPSYMWFLEYNNNPIGLINAYPHEDRLVVKTIGILPKYRGKKLSHLLIRKVHDQASKDGLKTATYAMVRVGNSAYKMKKPGIKINRHYMTMKKSF